MRLPNMDTVDDFLKVLEEKELEILKSALVSALIEKRVFHKFKFLGKSFVVAVDATLVASYDKKYSPECQSRTSKNGKTTYSHSLLEAKLVTTSGLCISLATEWLNNQDESLTKQDSELGAFKRLAEKIKQFFPRLPICIVADGLYPNQTFMEICKQMNWDYIVTLKDGSLKALQRIISVRTLVCGSLEENAANKNEKITRKYKWINNLEHLTHKFDWVECVEEIENMETKATVTTHFVYITTTELNAFNVRHVAQTGRSRWKIENEGFNVQKNHGYNLGHKYSRSSFKALKNYYQCLQIAHMINQLTEACSTITDLLLQDRKLTIKHLSKTFIATLIYSLLDIKEFDLIDQSRYKIRLC